MQYSGRHKSIYFGLFALSVGIAFFSSCSLLPVTPLTPKSGMTPPQCAAQFENHTLPTTPIAGEFKKQPLLKFDNVTLEEGVLSFNQIAPERHVKIYLGVKEGEVPVGQVFQLYPPGVAPKKAPISGLVQKLELDWSDKGPNGNMINYKQVFDHGPALWLTFIDPNADPKQTASGVRKLVGDTIDGQIDLCFNDNELSFLAGKFTAQIKGYRLLPNGLPDLTTDSVKNFQYLAEEKLKDDNASIPVDVLSVTNGRIDPPIVPGGEPTSGYIEITYRRDQYDQDGAKFMKFLFTKEDGRWVLHQALEGFKLGEAHPPRLPDPLSNAYIVYLAAQKVEADVSSQFPGAEIKDFTSEIVTYPVKTVSKINVKYRLEGSQFASDAQATVTPAAPPDQSASATTEVDLNSTAKPGRDFSRSFMMTMSKDGKNWQITQELTGTQDIDPKTGDITGNTPGAATPASPTSTPPAPQPKASTPTTPAPKAPTPAPAASPKPKKP